MHSDHGTLIVILIYGVLTFIHRQHICSRTSAKFSSDGKHSSFINRLPVLQVVVNVE